jgi:ankyrin repeat protein
MKKSRRKISSLFLALGVCFACVPFGTANADLTPEEELREAVACLRFDTVARLLRDESQAINMLTDRECRLLLFNAVRAKKVALVTVFLEKGVNPNQLDAMRRCTPLQYIIDWSPADVEIAQLLIYRGGDINAVGPQGTALIMAINRGDLYGVKELLKLRASPVAGTPRETPMEAACRNLNCRFPPDISEERKEECKQKRADIVRTLIEAGVDINDITSEVGSVLHKAVNNGDLETTRQLINIGASAIKQNSSGVTPLRIVCRQLAARKLDGVNIENFQEIIRVLWSSVAERSIFGSGILELRDASARELALATGSDAKVPTAKIPLNGFRLPDASNTILGKITEFDQYHFSLIWEAVKDEVRFLPRPKQVGIFQASMKSHWTKRLQPK